MMENNLKEALKKNKEIIKDRKYNNGTFEDKEEVTDKNISEILK